MVQLGRILYGHHGGEGQGKGGGAAAEGNPGPLDAAG